MTHKLEAVAGQDDTPLLQTAGVTMIAREAARQVSDMADARGVEIVIQDDMPEVTIDVGRLELALVNLLSNAIKYCDQRKPHKYAAVTATPADRDGWWLVRVEDNGVGIPSTALDTVFRRFTRAHVDREEFSRITGIGLGLAIVADCALAMGGDVDVASLEGERTTFTLKLPASPHLG
jgi:signal transduction histidine kinase